MNKNLQVCYIESRECDFVLLFFPFLNYFSILFILSSLFKKSTLSAKVKNLNFLVEISMMETKEVRRRCGSNHGDRWMENENHSHR